VISGLRSVQFGLREKVLGRIIFRPGLPQVPDRFHVSSEHRFYRMLIEAFYPDNTQRNEFNRVIDVGCRNGSYLPELRRLFAFAPILGIELDAYRRYWNLFRRADYAKAHALSCEAEVLFADFLQLSSEDLTLPAQGKVLMTGFFPFVSDQPCLQWGLPTAYSDFVSHIEKIKSLATHSLKIEILTAHQGEWEAERVRSLPGIQSEKVFQPATFKNFWPSPHPVHLFQIFI
jgi:hypothetical protein